MLNVKKKEENIMKISSMCLYVFFYCINLLCDAKEVGQRLKYHTKLSEKLVNRYNYNSSFLSTNSFLSIHNHIGSHGSLMKANKIVKLPGQPKVNFDQYGGYITVDPEKGRALYYYFVESPQNSYTKPLLLWLNGGPGCSSLGYGAMMENGPFNVKKNSKTLVRNRYSWNNVANILYLDSPAGTGFSYSNTTSDYDTTEDRTASDSYTFLINWLERFPQYITRNFFIAGESAAGRMIPQLAQLILHNNRMNKKTTINLQGIAIGNPDLNRRIGDEEMYKFYWSHALIPEDLYLILKDCNFSYYDKFNKTCFDAYVRSGYYTSALVPSNIYSPDPDCDDPNSTSEMYNPDPCSIEYVTTYLNMGTVQKALHADVTDLSFAWEICNYNKVDQSLEPITHVIEGLITEGINIWIYRGIYKTNDVQILGVHRSYDQLVLCGDTDTIVPTLATRRIIKSLGLPVKNEWYPWYYKNEIGGYVEEYEGLTFVTFKGAGHMVPYDQPERALLMISYFLETKLPVKT